MQDSMGGVLEKLIIEFPFEPVIPIQNICPQKLKAGAQTDTSTPMSTGTQITIPKKWN